MFKYRLQKIILVSFIMLVILHIIWQLIAVNLYPDNRVIVDIAGRLGLDSELSIPTWTSSIVAMMAAGLSWHIYNLKKDKLQKFSWAAIFLVGLFISVDEVAAIHELILQGLHILADFGEGNQSVLANAWLLVIPFIFAFLAIGFRYVRRTLPKDTFRNLVVAVSVYLSGALLIEALSAGMDKSSLVYLIGEVVVEESLEFIGLWLLLGTLMKHIEKHENILHQRLIDIFKS